jgi:hypothetical protein
MNFIESIRHFLHKTLAARHPSQCATDDLPERDAIIVAEIRFDRGATAIELRQLGEALDRCMKLHGWIADISGLEELLRGEYPMRYSRAIVDIVTGEETRFYDPILVWGKLNYPGTKKMFRWNFSKRASPRRLVG